MDNDGEQLTPPSPARVGARALALGAVICRGFLEVADDAQEAEDRRQHLIQWLDRVGIADEIEEREDVIIRSPVRRLDDRSTAAATWRSEGMLVLAWSLGRVELMRHDEPCDSAGVAGELGFLQKRSDTVLARPSLRESALVQHWADTYLTIHWRLRQYGIDPGSIDFRALVARANWGPLTLANVPLVDGDLEIRGERIDRVSEKTRHEMLSIAQERHQAFNWLLGRDPIYSSVATAT
jgi:hypothetical protein